MAGTTTGSSPSATGAALISRREYLDIRMKSTTPRTAYSRKNPTMLNATSQVLTEGETPSLVSWIPCTIHGCLPFSVRTHPAVLITNGRTAAQTATRRNQVDVPRVFLRSSHSPHSENRNSTPAV